MKYIDTHAHYYTSKFKNSLPNLIKDNFEKELQYIINLGTDVKSNQQVLKLVKDIDMFYGMVGFFPTSVYQIDESLFLNGLINRLNFEKQLREKKIVGLGEIGLDYHWDCVGGSDTPKIVGQAARNIQKKWFLYQLNLAKDLDLPASMHSRDAEQDTLSLFEEFESIKGVMHCFSYGLESAKRYLDKGLYLGIGGTSTYKDNIELRDVIKYAPLNRLLLDELEIHYIHLHNACNRKYGYNIKKGGNNKWNRNAKCNRFIH